MRWYHQANTALLLALSLLTRFPVDDYGEVTAADSGRSALFYPVVGLFIGGVLYLPVYLFANAPSTVLAAIVVTVWAIMTGGLHLDGLADSADGWLGGLGDKERTLRIMKDPVIGAAGAIAIVCLLLLKWSVVSALIQQQHALFLLFVPAFARGMILLTFLSTPYANATGMANTVVANLPKRVAWLIVVICFVSASLLSVWGVIAVMLGFYLMRKLMLQRLGGCTGDTVGALVEVSEMLFLLGAVVYSS